MRIEYEPKLNFDDVLIRPKRSTIESRKQVQLNRKFLFKHSQNVWDGIPIIAANMDGVGTMSMAESLSSLEMLTCLSKYVKYTDLETWLPGMTHVSLSIGSSYQELDRLKILYEKINVVPEFICLDVANGYTETFYEAVSMAREFFDHTTIIAGNVVTPEMVEALLLVGADIVKVGIGPGSVCETRVVTGVGYPQLSAIIECADAAHGLNGHIIADGGCRTPGDIAKAFGAGADFVMLGGMLAGHDESEGEIVVRDDKQNFVEFYGMSSNEALKNHHINEDNSYRASEGKLVLVPYRGKVYNTTSKILGGLRSACAYVGAESLKELSKRTTFVVVHNQQQYNTTFGEYK